MKPKKRTAIEMSDPIKNPYLHIPDCDFCHFAAGVYIQISGDMQGKNICGWCLGKLRKKNIRDELEPFIEALKITPLKNTRNI